MIPVKKRLDEVLGRYHTLGRRKRKRILDLVLDYVPHPMLETVLDKTGWTQWVSWETMSAEQRNQARKLVAPYIEVWTTFWFNNWGFKLNSKGDVCEVRKG